MGKTVRFDNDYVRTNDVDKAVKAFDKRVSKRQDRRSIKQNLLRDYS